MAAESVDYIDFDLLVEKAGTGYRARVLQSPVGPASRDFALPFTDQDLKILMLTVGRTRKGTRSGRSQDLQPARDFGSKLFDAIFTDKLGNAFIRSMDRAQNEGKGLRVRLHLDEAPELLDLPWEFLYSSAQNRFLALSVKTPIVRSSDVPEIPRSLRIEPPLRVLVIISSPTDYEQLDVEGEWNKLKAATSDLTAPGLLEMERLDHANLAAFQSTLRKKSFHILHFIGHGEFDPINQEGMLVFENAQRRGERISGSYLAPLIANYDSLRLVVLNACEGARSARTDPFAGVAQTLVQQGLPAVIAMQFEITDEAANVFGKEFYGALADGYPVDSALTEARNAILAQCKNMEWGTPVLYLRSANGVIFNVAKRVIPPPRVPVPIASPRVRTWLVAAGIIIILVLVGLAVQKFSTSNGSIPPTRTSETSLPTQTGLPTSAATVAAGQPSLTAVVVPNADTATSTPTASQTATPTQTPLTPTDLATVTPTATLTLTSSPTIIITPKSRLAPNVYVSSIRIDPPNPRSKQDFVFYVTFLNTSGTNFDSEWNVTIYRPEQRDNFGKPPGRSHILLNQSEVATAPSQQTIPSGCQSFYAVATIRRNQFGQIIDMPFPSPAGKQNHLDFTICR